MITIGLTTWSDHQSLMPEKKQLTLADYAAFFPTVEIDSLFYGLKTPQQVRNWRRSVPKTFQFIVKSLAAMTQHKSDPEQNLKHIFTEYKNTIQPLTESDQLKTILFQFPPFFGVSPENVRYLIQIRKWLPKLPITVEFRNTTWYETAYLSELLSLLKKLRITLTVVDEPQTKTNSVPFYPVVTNPKLVLFRLHGRNLAGWANQDAKWRKTRTLYRYNDQELSQFAGAITKLSSQAEEVCVIFNNNSGGDAADNALQLKAKLHLTFKDLAPRQIDLF